MNEPSILKFYSYIKRNWNSYLAGISIIGLLVFSVFPQFRDEKYMIFFGFLGANAIIWTLIELKMSILHKDSSNSTYLDMREARSDILGKMKSEIKANRRKELTITIIGGRIRTISDMVRELKNDFIKGRLRGKNITFEVFCMEPDFIKNWNFPLTKNDISKKKRNEMYSDLIKRFSEELLDFNEIEVFKSNNIKIEIKYYKKYPSYYYYLIGENHLFWGFFTWNSESEDFEGPTNTCFYMKKGEKDFHQFLLYFQNRTQFLEVSNQL
jgi:hypothetical protein